MVGFSSNNIESLEKGFDMEDHSKVSVYNMSKPLLNIWQGKGDSPKSTVELDRDSKRYINVVVDNVIFTYKGEDKVEHKEVVEYPLG